MRMPFGKYRNVELEEIPESYLLWVLDNCDIGTTLRRAIQRELQVSGEPSPAAEPALAVDVVGVWYRRLAMEFHPDRGGSHDAMKAVNRGRELLTEMLEETP